MTYPFLEAQGMQLKNLNKATAAYLPKSSGVKKIKIALQLTDQAMIADAFVNCNISAPTASAESDSDTNAQEAENERDARGPRSGSNAQKAEN